MTRTVRTALVLGGSSDIARAVLAELASELEHVLLAVRDPSSDASRAAVDELSGLEVELVAWDAREVGSHRDLVERAVDRLGRIDLVLCAVGSLGHHAGLAMAPPAVDDMVRTNFAGPAAALAAVAERLVDQGDGTLVVLSSVAGVRPRRSNYVYGSTKAGLDAFTRGLADAVVGAGVTVLLVRPGFVRSRMTEGLDPAPFASTPPKVAAAVVQRIRTGRGGVVWVPRVLGPLFGVLANVPAGMWRRIAGDR